MPESNQAGGGNAAALSLLAQNTIRAAFPALRGGSSWADMVQLLSGQKRTVRPWTIADAAKLPGHGLFQFRYPRGRFRLFRFLSYWCCRYGR